MDGTSHASTPRPRSAPATRRPRSEREAALCCPVLYDPRWLERIPQEIKDKDYGRGDPSAYVREGDVVLDLGSGGGGKICYIAAQIVGKKGRVIGVDFEMLGLARKYRRDMAKTLSATTSSSSTAAASRISALPLDEVDAWLAGTRCAPPTISRALEDFRRTCATRPMIADESVMRFQLRAQPRRRGRASSCSARCSAC